EEYGGSGADALTCTLLVEEAFRVCAGAAATILTASLLAPMLIIAEGNEEQKKKYLPGIPTGERVIAFTLTEPNAGSDTAGIQTVARPDGDHYIVNGSKTFISNGATADAHVLVAYTDKSKGYKGIDSFIIDADLPGITVTKKLDKLGWRSAETVELVYEDVRIHRESKLGSKGLAGALRLISFGRIMVGGAGVGLAQAAFDACYRYTKEREAFGQPVANFQVVAHRLAKMKMEIETGRLLTRNAAWMEDNGISNIKECAWVKYYCGELAKDVTLKALHLFGGYGFMNEFPVSRYLRDAQALCIADGTSDIQLGVIADEIGVG
ncbi:MAG: acyl-CoA dehydrogenase family protein, partial [Thermodesulfobacteriota bacterium]|nr:acyl-CoA dehydrogenase family protein [Thermodesulfobacteriota bacterium]